MTIFPKTFTGDDETKRFISGFNALNFKQDVRVVVNGVLKTFGTDYAIETPDRDSGTPVIAFFTAPTWGHPIKLYRNTPLANSKANPEIGPQTALRALYREQEQGDARKIIKGFINETDTLAGTAKSFVAPCDGYIELLRVQIAKAVTTGGAVTVEVAGVAVTGLSCTVADGATAGFIVEDLPTDSQSATTKVRRGQTITVTPAAAFATAGALLVEVEVQPADLD